MNHVQVYDLKRHLDDRGSLYEIIRTDAEFKPKLNQVYVVCDRTPGTIRAFHKHEKLWDYFHIISGSAKFIFYKQGKDDAEAVVLDSRKPQLIVVPPKVYHGWMSLEDGTTLVSVASELYNSEKPDEERVGPFVLGREVWQIQHR